jgi:hypothetical protein
VRHRRCRFVGGALLTIASPALAEMQSFTIEGHQFRFDVPSGYEKRTSIENIKEYVTFYRSDFDLIAFTIVNSTVKEEFEKRKDVQKSGYLYESRVAYHEYIKDQVYFGYVFAGSCSGMCIINVAVAMVRFGDRGPPFDLPKAEALLAKYAEALGESDFGGK